MKFDKYAFKARIVPAFFSMILPIMVFNHFFVSEQFSAFVGGVMGSKLFSNLTLSGVCLYFISEFGRVLGKGVFERKFYSDEIMMPTTNMLMYSDGSYSTKYKDKFRQRIYADFNIELPTKDEEHEDEKQARVRIVETIALVRKKLHGNEFLLQHNIEYGAMRNAIGGSILGAVFSIVNILFFTQLVESNLAAIISVITLLIYCLLILFSKSILNFYGRSYAKILFREYLGGS